MSARVLAPRVLVMDGHSRAAVESVQSLGRAGAVVDVASADALCFAFRSRHAAERIVQPEPPTPQDLHPWLRALDARRRYDLVVPTTENSLLVLRALPESDPLRTKAVLPSDAALDVGLDKQRTWEEAVRLGIPVPASTLLPSGGDVPPALTTPDPAIPNPAIPNPAFPMVLKPVRSKVRIGERLATPGVAIVTDDASRRTRLAAWLPFTAVQQQEWVPGRGAGVEVLYDRGRLAWAFLHERLHEMPLSGGASSYRRSLAPRGPLLEAARRLLDALSWHGVAMVEFRVAPDGSFRLMEINPRLWGSLPLSIAAGVDFPRGLLALARGEPVPRQPRYRVGWHARDVLGDVDWFKENLRADRRDRVLLTRPVVRSCLEPLRALVGRESWDHFRRDDPAVGRAILGFVLARNAGGFARRLRRGRLVASIRRGHARVASRPFASVLFLCHGNICRSPFAHEVARHRLPGIRVSSAGLHAVEGRAAPPHVAAAARDLGVDLSASRSRRVTSADVAAADRILVFDLENWERLEAEFPSALPKATLLGLYDPAGPAVIEDPYAMAGPAARRVLERIARAVAAMPARFESRARV